MDARELHAIARRVARRCRWIVQGCLREEEWRDADIEFYRVVCDELLRLKEPEHGPGRGESNRNATTAANGP